MKGRIGAGWALCAGSAALCALAGVLAIADGPPPGGALLLSFVIGFGSTLLGAFIVTRHPGHPIGWLFIAGGLLRAISVAGDGWAYRALVTHPGSLPAGPLASWFGLLFFLGIATAPLIVLLFPDGRLPGRRWRVVPVLAAIAALLYLTTIVLAWPYRGPALLPDAPYPDTAAGTVAETAVAVATVIVVAAVVLALAGSRVRFRLATGDVRQQLKWFGFGASGGFLINLAALLPHAGWLRPVGGVVVLAGIGTGIFRFRLFDVDRLIRRTLVYGLLTLALAGAFAAADLTLALIVGRGSVLAAAAAAFLAALLLRPVRDRLQDLIDTLFDRRTHDAVRTLQAWSRRIGHEPVHPAAVRAVLRDALHDPGLDVWFRLREPDLLVDCAGTPAALNGTPVTQVGRDGDPIALIRHGGADAAAVLVAATPILEHARLQAELSRQLAEVRASRARLVNAADAERRRIERDLHDGAQQRLVGLAVHIQAARRHDGFPAAASDLLGFTVAELQAGLDDIRGLVHGLLPPALTAGGLPAAVADLARPGQVYVTCAVPDRPPPGVEATAWFVACEGVANAAKHAPGVPVSVDVSASDGRVRVSIADDGPGGADPSGDGLRLLADRVEAHGGTLKVDSPAGGGTRLSADLPCAS
jgi:signal transduction histidine kinase